MKVLDKETKFAHLGKPGSEFSNGFERRLNLIKRKVKLEKGMKLMDQGCGEGVWLDQFGYLVGFENVYGEDIDQELISKFDSRNSKLEAQYQIPVENLKVCPAENLDFEDNFFDLVFSNEVLEHVVDDRKSVEEAVRVLKPGGKFIIFTPNRGWPFETHGAFWRGKYIWGNIPFLPWMPKFVRKKFSPHVRNYSNGDIKKLFKDINVEIMHHSHVFPAFDKLERKFGVVGKFAQRFFHTIEKTPLHFFGISHFVIVRKFNSLPNAGED